VRKRKTTYRQALSGPYVSDACSEHIALIYFRTGEDASSTQTWYTFGRKTCDRPKEHAANDSLRLNRSSYCSDNLVGLGLNREDLLKQRIAVEEKEYDTGFCVLDMMSATYEFYDCCESGLVSGQVLVR
jgi:hypothetical protein